MNHLLPTLGSENRIEDGSVIEPLPYCKEHCQKKTCADFYAKLKTANSGFYTCPKGLTSYVIQRDEAPKIYTSLRVKGYYRKGSDSALARIYGETKSLSPVISEELFLRLTSTDVLLDEQSSNIEIDQRSYGELLHDIRKICAHIKNKSEDIIKLDEDINSVAENANSFDILQKVKNIEALSGIAVSRFEVYDISMNPTTMCFGNKRRRVVYQKFHKARYMLTNYLEKNVSISLQGQSVFEYPIYQTFDALPFIILENAVKYAPNNSDVIVTFREEYNNLYVTIASQGPFCNKDEIDNIFRKGFRSSAAQLTAVSGQGLGLSIVKDICDAHNIKISITSNNERNINRIAYGKFEVNLSFFKQFI